MAEGVLQKLEEHLQCSICLEQYSEPRQLPCHHVFCSSCLTEVLNKTRPQPAYSLTCPSCRKVTKLPTGNVEDLQLAFHMTSLLDITSNIRDTDILSVNTATGGGISSSFQPPSSQPSLQPATLCSAHEGEPVRLFCETCGEIICCFCAMSEGDHHSHSYMPLSKAYNKYQASLEELLNSLTDGLDNVTGAITRVDAAGVGLKEEEEAVEKEIVHAFQGLHHALTERQKDLLDHLKEASYRKTKLLSSRKDELEMVQARIGRSVEVLKDSLGTGDAARVLKSKKNMEKQVDDLASFLQRVSHYSETGQLKFQASSGAAEACREYGELVSSDGPDPEKCSISIVSSDSSLFQVGENFAVKLLVFNSFGEPLEEDVASSFMADLLPKAGRVSSSMATKGIVKKVGLNEYEILYIPSISGSCSVHVKLLDQHVQGSPVCVEVQELQVSETTSGSWSFVEMKGILAIAVSSTGSELVVARANKPCITVFDSLCQELCSFGQPGFGKGCLNNPRAVAINEHEEIAVVDSYNNRVLLFNLKGEVIAMVGGKQSRLFDHPQSVSFSEFNKRWYVLDQNEIHVLKNNLDSIRKFKWDSKKGRLPQQSPCVLACDSKGNLYIANTGNNCVKAISASGSPILYFGTNGCVSGSLSEPVALCCGSSSLYVCEKWNNQVSMYNGSGKFVTFLKEGDKSEPLKFQEPRGVAVDSFGCCYVCDKTGLRRFPKML